MGVILLHEIMEKRFHEIKENFKRASAKNNIVFNEDIFIDTYIKCCEQLKNKEMNESQIIQYFWVSFVNNIKKSYRKSINNVKKVEVEEALGVIDEVYDDRRCKVYDIIIKHVKSNFTKEEYNMWYLHFVENKSYEELTNMGYTGVNFHNIFRSINHYIKTKLPKENKEYNTIIKEIFRKK